MLAIEGTADALPIAQGLLVIGTVFVAINDNLVLMKIIGEKIPFTAHIVEDNGIFGESGRVFFANATRGRVAGRQRPARR